MKSIDSSSCSKLHGYGVNENIKIYNGRFCIYIDKKYKCFGKVYLNVNPPLSIRFSANILYSEDIDDVDISNMDLNLDQAVLSLHGYKISIVTIDSINSNRISGFLNDSVLKSKSNYVDFVEFDVLNFNKYSGNLIKDGERLYAGRMDFEVGDLVVVLDKREDYRKELYEELKAKSGSIITHTGRLYRKDKRSIKSGSIIKFLDKLSISMSFACGRHVGFIRIKGYNNGKIVYKLWNEASITPFKFIPNWTDTISNHHNIEKYLVLMCKKLDDSYFEKSIKNIINWYIESLNSMTLDNNIVSVQVALETLSYIIIVEHNKLIGNEQFDKNSATMNLRMLLDTCKIEYGKQELTFFDENINDKFDDGIDILVYYRNTIVHPSRKSKRARLNVDDMWNIISIGTRYIELVLLYVIGYRGEYSNRLKDRSYGEVEVVPWC